MSSARNGSQDAAATGKRRGRPTKDAADAAARIRAGALRVFAREGFNGASVQAIADAAGVAKPLIHYHYASKDALWRAALDEAFAAQQRELEAFRAQMANVQGDEALRLVARQLAQFAGAYPELTRIVVDETSKGGARADWLTREYLLPGYRLAQLLIGGWRAAQPLPASAPPGPEHVIPAIIGVMNFPALEAGVIREAFGVGVEDPSYRTTQEEVLYRVLRALL